MGPYRILLLVVVVLVTAVGLWHGVVSYGWTGEENVPKGVPPVYVKYTCGAPYGSAYVHGPAATKYPVEGVPCGQRPQYRLMVAVDVIGGGLAIAFLVGQNRRARSHPRVA